MRERRKAVVMKIVRILNAAAVCALLGSATYAYSIKYETILYSAKIHKLENANQKTRDQIGILRAEWAHQARPERVQLLAGRHLHLQQLKLDQIVHFKDLPDKPPKIDSIGRQLKLLGLAEPTNTPRNSQQPPAMTTPSSEATGSIR
ncbi:MAG: hypothetical protein AB7J19_03765 [Beijerinckiaceae bacterium]